MKFKILSISILVIFFTIIVITFVFNKEAATISKQYNSEKVNTIEILSAAANIKFVASENSEITVQATENMKIDTMVSGDMLRITTNESANGIVNLKNKELQIAIPTSTLLALRIKTESGKIEVEDLNLASFKATSISGEITVKRITNPFTIMNESGNVDVATIGDAIGHSSIKTNSGHIHVQFSKKPQAIVAETKTGRIATPLFSKTSIQSQHAGYRLQEGLETEDEFLQLNSVSGNIHIH